MDYNITYRQKDKGWQFIISYKDENGNKVNIPLSMTTVMEEKNEGNKETSN